MKKLSSVLFVFGLVTLVVIGCKKDPGNVASIEETTPYTPTYPDYFPEFPVSDVNPMTEEGVNLGRHLYYDVQLSENGPMNGMSCSSCHTQSSAFTNASPGRAALPHINLAWNTSFLWDGKVEGTVEEIMKFEVEEFFVTDISVLQNDPNYPSLFKKAFGSSEITHEKTAFALGQFFKSLISGNTKFDRFLSSEGTLTASELNGLNIFTTETGDCFHCHSLPLMSDNQFHNIGLDSVFAGAEQGRYVVTSDPVDIGKFKTPTLRNIELTAPYMHDGRFATLEEVIDHYDSGVLRSATLDPIMTKNGGLPGLNLTPQEKLDLVAFLKTLTDVSFTIDPAYSAP